MGGTAKKKGQLLEDLVAALHRMPGTKVETRVQLPSIRSGSTRKREVDVLLTTEVHGHPIRLAFSCKNERRKVREGQVSQFIGDLEDVGIPPQCGIVVTPTGFTSDALRLAVESNLRPLIFEGMHDSGLSTTVLRALRAFVCVACEWRDINFFDADLIPAPTRKPGWCSLDTEFVVSDPNAGTTPQALLPWLLTHLWELWDAGRIPLQLAAPTIFVRAQSASGGRLSEMIVELRVFALVASLRGEATNVGLRHAQTKRLEKHLVTAKVPFPEQPLPMQRMDTEEEIAKVLADGDVQIVERIRVPRLLSGPCYWPPTKAAMTRLRELVAEGKPVSFDAVEGPMILKAWEFVRQGREAES